MSPLPRKPKRKGSKHNLYLGVDGGGTKTHIVLVNNDGEVVGEGFSGASNPLRVGIETAVSNILDAVYRACDEAGLSRGDIVAAMVGLAGLRRADLRQRIRERLVQLLRNKRIEVGTDAEIALLGIGNHGPGLVIIAGTGSVAIGRNSKGERFSAGGWGPIAGDEGGGAGIALSALHRIAKASDGRAKPTAMSDMAVDYFRAGKLENLSVAIYAPQVDNARIAGFAKSVSDAARAGDAVAVEVLAEAGRELGLAARAVVEKLKLQRSKLPIGLVGSVFKSGRLVTDSLLETVRAAAPKAFLYERMNAPAYSAALMAFANYDNGNRK
jgi:N-acetylglucosamine kinase-like BadF-type ATPase